MANTPLTPENFEKLLLFLDSDRERAGEVYEFLWSKAREYFSARACIQAEELADEVISRLAKKIAEGEEVRDVLRYSYGLARWVWMEFLRKPDANYVPFDELPILSFAPTDTLLQKEQSGCYLHCMDQLSEKDRKLVIKYHDSEDQVLHDAREELARSGGISVVALRIRITRIKKKLESCYSDCKKKGPPKTK
ncbi:MAG: sigma-70 family RNA polymerase sigma factor [Blastocatellia bacterium]